MIINLDQAHVAEPRVSRRSKLLFLAYSLFGLSVAVML
jgi:hypothetical protein